MKRRKRRTLKKWLVNLLLLINAIALLILASDCESNSMFIYSKVISAFVFIANSLLLYKKSNLFEE